VNVLDENILESQRQLLRSWRIPVRQIGVDIGKKGMSDEQILPFLLTLTHPTLFTRDLGFADQEFCHYGRCIVVLAVGQYEAAYFARRFLRHPDFNTHAKRMGAVLRVTGVALTVFRVNAIEATLVAWRD
jgi:hypothetical protein